jgi:polysaccharide biosynthesis protein PslH
MKILILTNKMPYPCKDGGSIATFTMAESFHNLGHKVSILAMNTSKHFIESEEIPDKIIQDYNLNIIDVNTDISFFKALNNFLFSKLPYNAERFISKEYSNKLKDLLIDNKFDVVQLEGLYLCPYIPVIRKWSDAKISLRSHNIEHEIWHRTALNETSKIRSLYLKILAKRIKNLKLKYINCYDFLVPITARDGRRYNFFGSRKPQIVIQTGVDMNNYPINKQNEEYPGFFHLGALDWMPNKEGLLWFLENIWKEFVKKYPEQKFYIAGRNATDNFIQQLNAFENVVYIGEVENANEFINSRAVMIVPLLSGSGMRIKIIEGMALGKLIITSSIGTEGIETIHNQNIIIADTKEDFISEMEKLLTNKQDFIRISGNAVKFVTENYDNKKITNSLVEFYQENL